MATHYTLTNPLTWEEISISRDRYQKIAAAIKVQHELNQIHILYSIAANTYIDLEKFMILTCLDWQYLTTSGDDFVDLLDTAQIKMNQKINAVLNSYRAFYDQLPQRLSGAGLGDDLWKTVKTEFSNQYDTHVEYRVMCALRNYGQHVNLPIQGIGFSISNLRGHDHRGVDAPSRGRMTFNPSLVASQLVSDTALKAECRADINNLNIEKLDIKALVRSYVKSVAVCRDLLCKQTAAHLDDSEATIQQAFTLFQNETEVHAEQLEMTNIDDDREFNIELGFSDRIRAKADQWSSLSASTRIYISSEIVADRKTFTGSNNNILLG